MKKRVAVVGATGAVGREMVRVLEKRDFPVSELRLLASERSAGAAIPFRGGEIHVEVLGHESFEGIELALFSAGAAVSKKYAASAVRSGAVVVDNSSAFRRDPEVPLVVPEVNPEAIRDHRGIIANPNCSTIIMIVPVAAIHRVVRVERIVVSTYQAVSGTGAQAIEELRRQVGEIQEGREPTLSVYPYQIAFNLFPHVDRFLENGYTREEMKMVWETRKILSEPELPVTATCVRVPVFRAHSEAVNLQLERKIRAEEVREILAEAPGVAVQDDPSGTIYPMPITASGRDEIFVGRIREDISQERGIDLWVVADQLLKGAALNAVQIAERLYGL
jgi:aspartate-semialdehyde dehydrogenase